MKPQNPIFTLVLFLLITSTWLGFGQQITFNKLLPPDGLNFEFVTGITQDINGIMWYSTKKGLYRYDGNLLSSYKNNPLNPNSIINNLLESIYADFNGDIWIGSLGQGLDRFDPLSEIFTHFKHDPNDPESLSNDTVTAILRDQQGTLWVGTHGGLDQFDPKTNKFIHFRNIANEPTSISNNQVREIVEDKQGILWVGTGSPFPGDGGSPEDGGLNRFNKETGTFTRYLHDLNDHKSLISNKVTAIFEDKQGDVWIGTTKNGLHKMNRQEGTFERFVYDPAFPEKLNPPPIKNVSITYEHITFFTQDAGGSYWFGTVDAGLYCFNPKIGKIAHYQGPEHPSEYTDNGAWKAFSSRDGVLWIGGTQGNIYHLDPLHKKIPHTSIAGAPVNNFYEEPNGVIWISTNQELIRTDKATGNTKRYLENSTPSQRDQNAVFKIKRDRQGNLWVGSSFGLNLWDKGKNEFIRYTHDPQKNNSISNKDVIEIYEDRADNFWLGTFRGLNLMDRKTGKFFSYFLNQKDTSTFGLNLVTSILEDQTGKLWVSAWNGMGVSLFSRENKTFKSYLKGTSIMCLYEDADGILWAGGNDGLYKFNPGIDNFIRYSDIGSPAGITDVLSIIEDNQKYLWIGSSGGIVKLNPQRNETSTYGKNFGIGENTLTFKSSFKGLNGDLYFGDATGYFSFSPVEFTQNLKAPEIVFTAFRLEGHTVIPGDGSPVKGRLSEQTDIELRHDQDIFSFDLAAIDYADPNENRLIYYLENYDNSWHPTSSEQRAYYFNVPPGNYTFRVRAVNSYGVWAEKNLEVIILPPWWRTWWAYSLYGLLLLVALFGLDRFLRQRLLHAEKERNRERELAQAKEIEKAYTELKATQVQLIQSEKMASLGELTAGIAHEIQNPLNFVNNFSEVNKELLGELNEEIDKGPDKIGMEGIKALVKNVIDNEEKIIHHGKRADAIVKGMLQHSRTSSGVKEPTDINTLADEYLRLAYHGHRAKDKSFNAALNTQYDPTIGTINIIPQEIGRVILNLITNAFYTVTEKKQQSVNNYEPTVTVSTKKMGNKVLITVKDNGNGIPPPILDKIFQPFFTTKPSGQGTGLGLSMSYDIIKAHGGELKVETIEGQSTEFTIELSVK